MPLILVGGQALNFWASRYAARIPRREAPLSSADVDFVGGPDEARACAERLGGTVQFAGIDHATANFAVVRFTDPAGHARLVDFLEDLCGVRRAEIERTALPMQFLDPDRKPVGTSLLVMHPVVCLESRLSNCVELPKYRSKHGLDQAAASIQCARAFLEDLLDAGQQTAVLKLNERIFRFRGGRTGRKAAALGLECFSAVLLDERLPEAFRNIRYPQMAAWVGRDRGREHVGPDPDLER